MYGKVFAQMFTGTLHGRLEATATFMALIALADGEGTVDMTLATLTALTGWPREFLEQGLRELEQPDPESRTPDEDGRRIVRLRDNTEWGWRIVNYLKYRQIRDQSGRRDYMRQYMRNRRSKQVVNSVNTGKQKLAQEEEEGNIKKGAAAPLVLHESLPRDAWEEWLAHRRERRLSMSHRALRIHLKLLAKYDTEIQREIIEASIGNGWEGLFPPKGKRVSTSRADEWR